MFTGIIEEIGQIKHIRKGPKSVALSITANKVLEDTAIGDSIATNGVCLTVTEKTHNSFTVDVMYETLNKTNIKDLNVGSSLNLERALTLTSRLGGHMVSGHIDGIGVIVSLKKEDIAWIYTIETTREVLKYIIKKGSIAIDGISLTVVDVTEKTFSVSIIPHTLKETILAQKKVSDTVNLECDLIGKYVEKLLKQRDVAPLSETMLKNYGF